MKKIFRVYFSDGNQRLYEAKNIFEALNYVVQVSEYMVGQILRIEEVEDNV